MLYVPKEDREYLEPALATVTSVVIDKTNYVQVLQYALYRLATSLYAKLRNVNHSANPFHLDMPLRESVRAAVDDLAEKIKARTAEKNQQMYFVGLLNYSTTELLLRAGLEELRYWRGEVFKGINQIVAMTFWDEVKRHTLNDPFSTAIFSVLMNGVPHEFNRRLLDDYEDIQILKNGDVGYWRFMPTDK